MTISVPDGANGLIAQLGRAGYEAYLVGGCVRDSLLGRTPGDWDIATSALPQQVMECFAQYPVLKTGLQHGTVTVLVDHQPYEVTTFRMDGAYTDNRHPDSVEFVRDLRQDLARRDFTVNALAWNPATGLVDYFHGREDLAAKRLACVGDAKMRFEEDALRMLRAVRFSATLEFAVAPATAAAMAVLAGSLANIAPERVQAELSKAVVGPGLRGAFAAAPEVVCAALPELSARIRSERWVTALQAAAAAPPDVSTRLTLLLGDGGEQAAADAAATMTRLRYDNGTRRRVERLMRWRGEEVQASEASVRRWLHRLGPEDFCRLMSVWEAEKRWGDRLGAVQRILRAVLREEQCYGLDRLAVGGEDLLSAGVPKGKPIGEMLNGLLDAVIDGHLPNDRSALLQEAVRRLS